MQNLEVLFQIDDPVKRRAYFIAILSEEIIDRGGQMPIVVGGEALELYTQGSYTTGDIDLKAPYAITEAVLREYGFIKRGRVWFNESYDLYIDLLGEALEEGTEAEKRTEVIEIADGKAIRVLSIEDLIIDRLNALKWWNDKDSKIWVKVLIEISKNIGRGIDMDYLKRRAMADDLQDILQEIYKELEI